MRTLNTYYNNKEDFYQFLFENSYLDTKSVMIQVFSSVLEEEKLKEVLEDILAVVPQAKLIGATTDGEILENVVTTDKIIVSVTAFNKATLGVAMQSNNDDSFACGKELARKLVQEDTKALFLFSDGLKTNGEAFLQGVKTFSEDIPLAGGMAGDAAKFETTYVMSNEGIISNGAVGIAVNTENLNVTTAYTFNWQEIGKELIVTKVKDNRVYEIDNKSAVDIYAKYLGQEIADLLPAVGIEFPLIITRDGIKVARAILGKEDDGSLIFAGNLAVGDKVHFGYGHSGMILKESMQMKDKFASSAVESIFIYSCMARRRFLEEAICLELTPLANIAPTAGFFTYGEFFKSRQCELLNQTMTVIAMSEGDEIHQHQLIQVRDTVEVHDASITQRALSHLVEETSNELTETNNNLERLVQEKTSALQEKIAELEHASKVKSDFLAGMSHEIRTPLNAMLGFVDILKAGETDKERLKRFNIIKSSGNSLLTIINDILDFSKIESGMMILEKRKFSTKKPFKEIGQLFYERAKEFGIDLKVSFSEKLPRFFVGDIVRIKQVAANFLSNAIKFTSKGGTIFMHIDFNEKSQELKFSVEDSGVGIDAKNLQKIFEAFTQEDSSTTRRFGGTGLGLSISTSLINSMQGHIEVESTLGKGSTFSFKLPMIQADEEDKSKDIFVDEINLTQELNATILLVEDNKTNQMLMNIVLSDLGINVVLAENGIEAVQKFKEAKFDLILMDENMPKMNGIEATKIILDFEKEEGLIHTPIIALTANALATDRAKFLGAGMDEFVSKPIDHEVFVRVLHMFLKPKK
jgi:signal transduction histidine kinase/ActR/RegA family two-component response regulator